jgi:hypothetical protein
MNKNAILKYRFGLFILGVIFLSCDEYDRTAVANSFFVNYQSLSLFVGEQIQLKASPTDGTYQYKWTSEDPTIATVDNQGKVEAISEGNTNILVSTGGITIEIPLTSIIRIPLEDVVLSMNSIEGMPNDETTVFVTYIPENANDIPNSYWISEDEKVALVDQKGTVSFIGLGRTNLIYRIGNIEKSTLIIVSHTKAFKGPHILSASAPLELPAADFDLGGEGYAFHDSDEVNHTNSNYRRDNGDPAGAAADVEGTGLGYTSTGEWFLYTVNVRDAGEYLFDISESAGANGGKFHLEVEGVDVTGSINVPNNGSWGAWRWFPSTPLTISFTEGIYKIKFYFEGGGFNLRSLRFIKK